MEGTIDRCPDKAAPYSERLLAHPTIPPFSSAYQIQGSIGDWGLEFF